MGSFSQEDSGCADSAKKTAGVHVRELLRLKKKEEDAIRAKAIAAQPTPRKINLIMARAAPESPIDDAFGA